MANLVTSKDFVNPFGGPKGADLGALTPQQAYQVREALKNMGFYQGDLTDTPLKEDFGAIGALGNFQTTFGYGAPSPFLSNDAAYGLLYANDQVVNGGQRASFDPTVAASLRAAKQYNPDLGVIDPTSIEQEVQARTLPSTYADDLDPARKQYYKNLEDNADNTFKQGTAQLDFAKRQQQNQYAFDQGQLASKWDAMRQKLPGEYAGRGLLNSGIYMQGLQDYGRQRGYDFDQLDFSNNAAKNQFGEQAHQYDTTRSNALQQINDTRTAERDSIKSQLRAIK
jgi:hypothetical protein